MDRWGPKHVELTWWINSVIRKLRVSCWTAYIYYSSASHHQKASISNMQNAASCMDISQIYTIIDHATSHMYSKQMHFETFIYKCKGTQYHFHNSGISKTKSFVSTLLSGSEAQTALIYTLCILLKLTARIKIFHCNLAELMWCSVINSVCTGCGTVTWWVWNNSYSRYDFYLLFFLT